MRLLRILAWTHVVHAAALPLTKRMGSAVMHSRDLPLPSSSDDVEFDDFIDVGLTIIQKFSQNPPPKLFAIHAKIGLNFVDPESDYDSITLFFDWGGEKTLELATNRGDLGKWQNVVIYKGGMDVTSYRTFEYINVSINPSAAVELMAADGYEGPFRTMDIIQPNEGRPEENHVIHIFEQRRSAQPPQRVVVEDGNDSIYVEEAECGVSSIVPRFGEAAVCQKASYR